MYTQDPEKEKHKTITNYGKSKVHVGKTIPNIPQGLAVNINHRVGTVHIDFSENMVFLLYGK